MANEIGCRLEDLRLNLGPQDLSAQVLKLTQPEIPPLAEPQDSLYCLDAARIATLRPALLDFTNQEPDAGEGEWPDPFHAMCLCDKSGSPDECNGQQKEVGL